MAGEVLCLFSVDARGQAVLAGLGELPDNALHPRGRFAFAENNLRVAAPFLALQINVSKAQIRERRLLKAMERCVHAHRARLNLFKKRTQAVRLHDDLYSGWRAETPDGCGSSKQHKDGISLIHSSRAGTRQIGKSANQTESVRLPCQWGGTP